MWSLKRGCESYPDPTAALGQEVQNFRVPKTEVIRMAGVMTQSKWAHEIADPEHKYILKPSTRRSVRKKIIKDELTSQDRWDPQLRNLMQGTVHKH